MSCFGFGFGFGFAFGVGVGVSLNMSLLTLLWNDWVFGGLPGFPFGSCFGSGLSYFGWSWLPDAGSPVGNGGNLPGLFFGEAPALCFGFALLSGVRSFLWTVLCSDVSVFFVRFSACSVLDFLQVYLYVLVQHN